MGSVPTPILVDPIKPFQDHVLIVEVVEVCAAFPQCCAVVEVGTGEVVCWDDV